MQKAWTEQPWKEQKQKSGKGMRDESGNSVNDSEKKKPKLPRSQRYWIRGLQQRWASQLSEGLRNDKVMVELWHWLLLFVWGGGCRDM